MHRRQAFLAILVFSGAVRDARADPTPRLVASWKEKDARVVIFSPDGRSLVSSGAEGHRLRDAGTGDVRAVLAGPRDQFNGPVFSPDGQLLYAEVGSNQFQPVGVRDLKVWDVPTGRIRGSFAHIAEAMGDGHFALSKDGSRLAFLDNSERLPMRVETSTVRFDRHDRQTFEVAHNANPGLPRVILWDVAGWKQTARVDGGLPLAFSPDGTTLATGDREWRTPVAKLWDVPTGRFRSELEDRTPGVWPLVFSPDGRFLASGAYPDRSLWEVADGRKWTLEVKGAGTRRPAFSPDGTLLFPDGLPRMDPGYARSESYSCFDLTRMPPPRLDLGPGEVIISPDGSRYAAVQGERHTGGPVAMGLHELASRREIRLFDVTGLEGARFSPDGRWLALLMGVYVTVPPDPAPRFLREIHLLDPATARGVTMLPSPGETWGNYDWIFSPDGNTLAVYYRTGSNAYRDGDPEPSDRPLNVEIWELPPR